MSKKNMSKKVKKCDPSNSKLVGDWGPASVKTFLSFYPTEEEITNNPELLKSTTYRISDKNFPPLRKTSKSKQLFIEGNPAHAYLSKKLNFEVAMLRNVLSYLRRVREIRRLINEHIFVYSQFYSTAEIDRIIEDLTIALDISNTFTADRPFHDHFTAADYNKLLELKKKYIGEGTWESQDTLDYGNSETEYGE